VHMAPQQDDKMQQKKSILKV